MSDVAEITRATKQPKPATFERNVELAAQGMGITFAGRLLSVAQRFVLAIVLARLLGAEQYGMYNLTLTAATLAGGFALLGLDTGLIRYVPIYSHRRDDAGLWGALQIGIGLPVFLTVGLGAGLFALAGFIAEQGFHEPQLTPLLRIGVLLVPFLTLSDLVAAATKGFKNQHYTVIALNIVRPVIKLVMLVLLAIGGLTASNAVIGYMVAAIVAALLLLYFLNRQFPLVRPIGTARRDAREILGFSLPVYLSDVIRTFTGNIQTLVLGTVTNVTTVGIYALAANVNLFGKLIHSSVISAAMPIIAELHDRQEKDQLKKFYQITTRWTFTLNIPLFLMLLLSPEALLSLFGKEFVNGAPALSILVWATIVATSTGTNGAVLDMTGYTKLKLANSVVSTVVTITLNVLLIPRMGILGAAIAFLVGTIIIESLRVVEVFVLQRILPYDAAFLKPIAAGVVAVLTAEASHLFLPAPDHYLIAAAMRSAVLLVVYVGVVLALGLGPEDRLVVAYLKRRFIQRRATQRRSQER